MMFVSKLNKPLNQTSQQIPTGNLSLGYYSLAL